MSDPDAEPGPDSPAPDAATTGASDRPRRRGCFHRLLRGCGWTLLAVFALLLIGYFVEVYRCSRFTPTGDALFDRYARAVIHRQAWRLFWRDFEGDPYLSSLPAETVARWEGEFGDDARYWQLKYWCAVGQVGGGLFKIGPTAWRDKNEPFAEGIVRGAADCRTYLSYYAHLQWRWPEDMVEELGDLAELDETATDEQRRQAAKVLEDYIQREREYLDNVSAAFPDEAWPHYYRAAFLLAHGQAEAAIEALHSGNQTPSYEWPFNIFPASFVRERLAEDDYPGSRLLTGIIMFEADPIEPFPHLMPLKDTANCVISCSAMGADAALPSQYHQFLCRMIQAKHVHPYAAEAALSWLSKLSYYTMENEAPYLDSEEVLVLLKARNLVQKAKLRLAKWDSPLHQLRDEAWAVHGTAPAVYAVGQLPPRVWIERFAELEQERVAYGLPGLRSIAEELTLLDYTSLDWPEEWGAPSGRQPAPKAD